MRKGLGELFAGAEWGRMDGWTDGLYIVHNLFIAEFVL